MSRSRVEHRRHDLPQLRNRLRALKASKVSVGIHAEDADTADGFNAAAIASVHEYGARNIPARPFIGPTVDDQRDEYTRLLARIARLSVMRGVPLGGALERFGLKVTSDIRATIDAGIDPPLSEATIAKREARNKSGPQNDVFTGHTPLRDTSQHIYNRLRHVVRGGGQ